MNFEKPGFYSVKIVFFTVNKHPPNQNRYILLQPLTCVFGRFPVHGPRRGPPLPAVRLLSGVALVRRLTRAWIGPPWSWVRASGARVLSPGTHLSSRVVGVGLVHVHRRREALGRVAWSAGGVVGRGLLVVHLRVEQST